MKYNMMTDNFIMEGPQTARSRRVSDRDASQGRVSAGSFASPMLHDNFGDWGFTDKEKSIIFEDDNVVEPGSGIEAAAPEYPFSVQNKDVNPVEENGFKVTDRRSFPKLPVSQREIRKVNLHSSQPVIVFDAGDDDGENDFIVSPMDFKSPLSISKSLRKHRTQPTRQVKRSVSDVGSFGMTAFTKVQKEPTNFRDLWSSKKGCELSMSFSERRRPSTNRELLQQIGEMRESYRNVLEFEDENDVEVDILEAQNNRPVRDNIEQDPILDDEVFEGTMPLKKSPTVVIKKRLISKNRMKKTSTKGKVESSRSRSLSKDGTSSPGRHARLRKNSLSDSKSSKWSESTDTTAQTSGTSKSFPEADCQYLLEAVRERRAKNSRRNAEKETRDKLPRRSSKRNLTSKKTPEREKDAASCRRPRARRASISMTGNIVDSQPDIRRRSSMDNHSSPKNRRFLTMGANSPSSNSPSDHQDRAKYKHWSKTDLSAPDLAGDEDLNNFPSRIPFGEEGTVSTQEGSSSGSFRQLYQRTISSNSTGPPSRKSSTSSRDREPLRRNQSAGESSKSFRNQRKLGRNRSDLARQKQRFDHAKKEDKSVSVEEILALVATTPKPSRRPVPARVKRWRSAEQLKGGDSAEFSDDDDNKTGSSKGERSRERSDSSTPRKKSRSRSRRVTRTRKGTQEESPKERSRHLRSRRASNK